MKYNRNFQAEPENTPGGLGCAAKRYLPGGLAKWLVLGLALICLLLAPLAAGAETEQLAGLGTQEEPYLIATAAELNTFARLVNQEAAVPSDTQGRPYREAFVQLSDNIELTDEFTPIGFTAAAAFRGSFDGHGYIISGLKINAGDSAEIIGGDYNQTDSAADNNSDGSSDSAADANSDGSNDDSSADLKDSGRAYGLFGYTEDSQIFDLGVADAQISVAGDAAAGVLIGNAVDTQLTRVFASGDIQAAGDGYIGGLLGHFSGTAADCFSSVGIQAEASAAGIAGFLADGSSIERAYAAREIKAEHVQAIAATDNGDLSDVYYIARIAEAEGAAELDPAAATQSASYQDFDFDNVWTMEKDSDGYAYPKLQALDDSVDVNFLSAEEQKYKLGLIETEADENIARYTPRPDAQENLAAQENRADQENLAAKYDPRGSALLPAVRDQDIFGTCWAFSMVACAELDRIYEGAAANDTDYSELQLVYFMYHYASDPLGIMGEDYTSRPDGDYLNGGDMLYGKYVLAGWSGLVNEALVPYSDAYYLQNGGVLADELGRGLNAVQLKNYYIIPLNKAGDAAELQTLQNEIKKGVREHGAASIGYYHDFNSLYLDAADSTNTCYFYNQKTDSNHAVAIVGWDDNYSKDNFPEANRPQNDGAWLIRNSWGHAYDTDGYFWMSYEERSLNSQPVYILDFEDAARNDRLYQYDGSGADLSYQTEEPAATAANVFTAQQAEQLEEVAFTATYNANLDYEVAIYVNPTGEPIAAADKPVQTQTGTTTLPGYYTVELDKPVELQAGDVFAVQVTLSDASGNDIALNVDASLEAGWIDFVNECQPGQSYVQENGAWQDISADNSQNLRIKAVTSEAVTTGVGTVQNLTLVPNAGALELSWEAVAGADSYQIWRLAEDESQFTLLAASDTVNYSDAAVEVGKTYYYKVRAAANAAYGAFSQAAAGEVPQAVPVTGVAFTTSTQAELDVGQTLQTAISITPADASDQTVNYASNNPKAATVDADGLITACGGGSAKIRVSTRDGGCYAVMTVTVYDITYAQKVSEMQSAHPYENQDDKYYIYTRRGAQKLWVTFSDDTSTEPDYDYIYIYDAAKNELGKYSGTELAGVRLEVPGDTVSVRLVSDKNKTDYGFRITKIQTEREYQREQAAIQVRAAAEKAWAVVNEVFAWLKGWFR